MTKEIEEMNKSQNISHPNIYIHSKQRQKTRDKRRKTTILSKKKKRKEKKTKGNPEVRKSIDKGKRL